MLQNVLTIGVTDCNIITSVKHKVKQQTKGPTMTTKGELLSRIEKARERMWKSGRGREAWDLMGRWELWGFCQVWF
jgi:hypothetical protein